MTAFPAGDIVPVTAASLAGMRHGFFTRRGGVSLVLFGSFITSSGGSGGRSPGTGTSPTSGDAPRAQRPEIQV